MKDYIEERAVEIANYIIETKATVRQTAKKFGISKSTVHMVVTKQNDFNRRVVWNDTPVLEWYLKFVKNRDSGQVISEEM